MVRSVTNSSFLNSKLLSCKKTKDNNEHEIQELLKKYTKGGEITFLLLGNSLGLLLQLVGLLLQDRIILLKRFNPSFQKIDPLQPLLRRLLKSSELLQLLLLIRRKLETLSSMPKILGLLSDLFSQLLLIKYSQDNYSTTEYKYSSTRLLTASTD